MRLKLSTVRPATEGMEVADTEWGQRSAMAGFGEQAVRNPRPSYRRTTGRERDGRAHSFPLITWKTTNTPQRFTRRIRPPLRHPALLRPARCTFR